MGELELIKAIADQLSVAIWVARAPDGLFVYANRAFAEVMGMGPEPEAVAGGYAPAYGIFDREGQLYREDRMPFARALAARAPVVVDDLVIHRRDGRRVYVRAFAQPMFDGDTITHVSISFLDITDEVTVEHRLARVLSQAPVVLFAFDRDGKITLSEGRGLERMGYSSQQLVGQNGFEIYRDRPDVVANCRRALAGETFVSTAQVGAGIFETTFTPQRDAHGTVIGVIGISADITERAEMQKRLVEVERLAAMGALAATVAHEINNPLTYVLANLDVLAARVDKLGDALGPGDATGTLIADIREGADRVRRIVGDLKGFSRENDLIEPTDIIAVIERSIALAEGELKDCARLHRDYRPVPRVRGNEARLGQVFVNLFVNAAQAMSNATGNEITVAVREESGSVFVDVRDNGGGIADDVRARIFEPFFTTKVGSGSGLGLAVSQQIVQRFGGELTVESELGRGSTFRVRLAPAPAASTPAPPSARPSPHRLRVLIIDDDERVAGAVHGLLATEHDVEMETDSARALQRLLEGARYDVVLCDVMMPGVSGIDLHRTLQARAPEQAAKIVFVTGGAYTRAAREFLASVENACLEKPFNARQLADVLRAV